MGTERQLFNLIGIYSDRPSPSSTISIRQPGCIYDRRQLDNE